MISSNRRVAAAHQDQEVAERGRAQSRSGLLVVDEIAARRRRLTSSAMRRARRAARCRRLRHRAARPRRSRSSALDPRAPAARGRRADVASRSARWWTACRCRCRQRRGSARASRTPRRRSASTSRRRAAASPQRHRSNCSPAPSSGRSGRASISRSGRAPWKEKIDCFSSPTTNRVASAGRPRPSAPAPAKNSSVRARMISHCSGAVSWASSTRMWSMPPSSLNSTQAASARRVSSRRCGRSGRRSRARPGRLASRRPRRRSRPAPGPDGVAGDRGRLARRRSLARSLLLAEPGRSPAARPWWPAGRGRAVSGEEEGALAGHGPAPAAARRQHGSAASGRSAEPAQARPAAAASQPRSSRRRQPRARSSSGFSGVSRPQASHGPARFPAADSRRHSGRARRLSSKARNICSKAPKSRVTAKRRRPRPTGLAAQRRSGHVLARA